MNFQDTIVAHLKWKERLKKFVAGSGEALDPVSIAKDDQCELGKWIHGEGKQQYGHLPQHSDVRTKHASFHQSAAKVVKLARAGDQANAQAMLEYGGEYYAASTACVNAITKLRDSVQ